MSTTRLIDIASIVQGGTKKLTGLDFVDSGYPAFGAGGINGYLSEYEFDRSAVVLSSIGARCGKCFLAEGKWTSLANTQLILPDPKVADTRFLWYQLNDEGRWHRSGTAQPFIKPSDVKTHNVYLPPIEEQRRIASILDAADTLRTKRRQALIKLDMLTQVAFNDMCAGAAMRLAIGDMLDEGHLKVHKDGNHGSLYPRAEEFSDQGIPFLSAKCVSEQGQLQIDEVQFLGEGKARTLKHGWIEAGDVLLSHNASVGKVCHYLGEVGTALIGTSLTVFRPNPSKLDSAFLAGVLRSEDFQRQLTGNMSQTTRNQVPITAQRRLTLPMPPMKDQRRFAEFAAVVNGQRASQLASDAELSELLASLKHLAFRGEL